jgi:hypothetical protein
MRDWEKMKELTGFEDVDAEKLPSFRVLAMVGFSALPSPLSAGRPAKWEVRLAIGAAPSR